MTRKPLSPEEREKVITRLNDVMRKACERMERRKAPVGVLAALDEQPREA